MPGMSMSPTAYAPVLPPAGYDRNGNTAHDDAMRRAIARPFQYLLKP